MAKLRYISLFSGIEAWSCAVKDMPEYEPVAFCEIDPFASAVLKHHYPDVPNLGDITKVNWSEYRGLVDLVVGGSPCQGFSQAGLRRGLQDDRSGLALAYCRCIEQVQPKWILWENVPGVLSCNNGQDYRAFLAELNGLGYSLSGTILDSQWFFVPQRRRRVFLVGYSGGWERPAKVLFKPESLRRYPPARKKKRKGDTAGTGDGAGNCGVSGTLCASGAGLDRPSASGNQLDYCIVSREREREREQPLATVGTLVASGACTERVERDAQDFLILDRHPSRERVVCAETAGALLSRDGKGTSSTIDGKLVALRRPEKIPSQRSAQTAERSSGLGTRKR